MSEGTLFQTLFSLSEDVPPAGSWPAVDSVASLRPGALVDGRSLREVCFIRKFSGGGALLHVDSPLVVGQRLELELMTGQLLGGTISARHGSEVALQFDAPVDVFAIIASDLVSQPGERRRMPRIELSCAVAIEGARGSDFVTARDVSQGGIKIECAGGFAVDEKVLVTLDGFRPVEGQIRWTNGPLAGIVFDQEISWQELMPWLKERRRTAVRRRPEPGADLPSPDFAESVDLNLPAQIREGTSRWSIDIAAITTRHVEFESYASPRIGTLLWLVLPGLEGWPARVTQIERFHFTCEFTHPLHPAVLERILADAHSRRN